MTQRKDTTDLTELLLKCMAEPNPMLSILEWLCAQWMEAELSGLTGAEKNALSSNEGYNCSTEIYGGGRFPIRNNVTETRSNAAYTGTMLNNRKGDSNGRHSIGQ